MIKASGLFILILSVMSCTSTNTNLSANKILPRKGYVFVKKIVNLQKCKNSVCKTGKITSAGSGFIVKITHKGSFIMTAAHVCATDTSELQKGVQVKDLLKVQTLDGRYYNVSVLKYNREIDACLMYADELVDNVQEVSLSQDAPKEGDKVYNIASPYGIHYDNVVPIFEGRYFGTRNFKAFYTFNAGPGSSGSMILNENGELIGLLHSVYIDMHSIVVSVSYDSLIQFIKTGLIEYTTSHAKELHNYKTYSDYGVGVGFKY